MSDRSQYFTCLVYPESALEDWLDIIKAEHIRCLISPLHDQDFLKDGSPEKPHYHIMACYDSLKSEKQAKAFFEKFGGCIPPGELFLVHSQRSYARYLCHLDETDSRKHHYDPSDVIVIGDLDYNEIISSVQDDDRIINEILDIIEDNDLIFFTDLTEILRHDSRFKDHFRTVYKKSTLFLKEVMKSREYKNRLMALSDFDKNR